MIRTPHLLFASATLALACAVPRTAAAEQILRYSGSAQGALAVTGNTLGLSGGGGTNGPTTNGSIATFVCLDPTSVDGDFPGGTTSDWTLSGSEAWLALPDDATVLYAELVWGGSWAAGAESVAGSLDVPVTLGTPRRDLDVEPDEATAVTLDQLSGAGFAVRYYVRSADVTNAIREGGRGMYSVSGVPATQDFAIGELNAAGWTLIVAYHSAYEAGRNLSVFVGGDWVDEETTVDTTVSGFCTPPTGEVLGRVLVSAVEGDAHFIGDSLQIGGDDLFTALEGPFNPADNFFGSQLNDIDGNRDTRGTFGDRNHDPVSGVNVAGGRQGWDITAVPVSSEDGHLVNGQTEATVRAVTTGDSFVVAAVGFAIDVNAPEFRPSNAVTFAPPVADIGDTVTVTVTIANDGAADAEGVTFSIELPAELTFVSGSFAVDGAVDGSVDAANLAGGILLGDVAIDAQVVVSFDVTLEARPTGVAHVSLQPGWDYAWRTCPDAPPVTARAWVPPTRLDTGILQVAATAAPAAGSLVGPYDAIAYTFAVTNSGSAPVVGATFRVPEPDGLRYVAGSARVDGLAVAGASPLADPILLGSEGAAAGTIAAGATVDVSASFRVSADPGPELELTAWLDPDGDGGDAAVATVVRHPVDGDVDGDGIPNTAEDLNGDGELDDDDTDDDDAPNFDDPDDDGDEVLTIEDNCPLTPNPDQEDADRDGIGDACEDDRDGDGVGDDVDVCPDDPDPGQEDSDRDGIGDACDESPDGDAGDVGHPDASDAFGDPDAGTDAGGTATSSSGCCAIAGSAAPRGAVPILLAAAAVLALRRRR